MSVVTDKLAQKKVTMLPFNIKSVRIMFRGFFVRDPHCVLRLSVHSLVAISLGKGLS